MIVERIVHGSIETSLHDFEFKTENMNLIISTGSYYQAGIKRYSKDDETVITIPQKNEPSYYEVWLTESGLLLIEGFSVVENPIDRLGWFSVEAETINLNEVEIYFVKVVESQ